MMYKYFVPYSYFDKNGNNGIGRSVLDTHLSLNYGENIPLIEQYIKTNFGFENVVIINFKRLKGGTNNAD